MRSLKSAEALGDFQRPGAGRERLVQLAEIVEVSSGARRPGLADGRRSTAREGLGLAQVLQCPPDSPSWKSTVRSSRRISKACSSVARGSPAVLEAASACSNAGPAPGCADRASRLGAGLPEVVAPPSPTPRPGGVMGEPLDLLSRGDRGGASRSPRRSAREARGALLQQAAVRDLVGERVLEGVLEIRKEPGLVEELGGLQVVEPATERLVRQLGDRLEQRKGTSLPTTEAACSRCLSSGGSRSMRAARIACTVGGTWIAWTRLRQPIRARARPPAPRLHQRPDGLLQEERVALA